MVLKDTNRRCLSLWPLGECRYNDFLFKRFNFKGTFLNLFSSSQKRKELRLFVEEEYRIKVQKKSINKLLCQVKPISNEEEYPLLSNFLCT